MSCLIKKTIMFCIYYFIIYIYAHIYIYIYFRANYVLKSERFGHIINLATKGQHDFPQVVKRGLMQAIIQVAIIVQNKIDQSYWIQTLQPLLNKFKQITSNENFLQCYHQEKIKIQVIDILEYFIGKF